MATEDLKTGLDIYKAALLDAGESDSGSGDYASDAARAVRQAYWSVLSHARWPWAMSPNPNVITTRASQRVTFSGVTGATVTLSANLTPSAEFCKVYLESTQAVYRILAHTNNTPTLVLDATYVETEETGPAVIFQDEYTLPPDVLRVWDPMWLRGWRNNPIPLLDKTLFEERYGRGSAWAFGAGFIEAACEVHPQGYDANGTSTNMLRQVRFAPWSEDALNIEHDYTVFHDLDFSGAEATDTPKIPREHRVIIANFAASLLLLNKDDTKSKDYATMGGGKLQEMVNQYIPSQSGRVWVRPQHSATLGLT